MENCQNDDDIFFRKKMNRVGEPTKKSATHIATTGMKSERMCGDSSKHFIDGVLKLQLKARFLLSIPSHCLIQFQPGDRAENYWQTHFDPPSPYFLSRSALTSRQGMPLEGLRRYSSSRRSSSADCAGLRAGSCPSSAILSQTASANCTRSDNGNAFAAASRSVFTCEF